MVKSLENIRKRKRTGGRIKHTRGRRSDEKDTFSVDTLLGDHSVRIKNSRGGNIKVSLVPILWGVSNCVFLDALSIRFKH